MSSLKTLLKLVLLTYIGKNKKYLGVVFNLVAYACKLSKDYGFDGVLSFDAKTALIPHYEKILGAVWLEGSRMGIFEERAAFLINKYFPETEEKNDCDRYR